MSAVSAINRRQLFHGTVADIPVGDRVRPAGRHNPDSHHGASAGAEWGQRSDEYAFATETERDAWHWADNAASMVRGYSYAPRPRVYRVSRPKDARVGVFHPDHPLHSTEQGPSYGIPEHVSKRGFPVKERVDIKPGHQGTFPEENWNRYRRPHYYRDVNHPDWNEINYGHQESQMRKDSFGSDEPEVHPDPRQLRLL